MVQKVAIDGKKEGCEKESLKKEDDFTAVCQKVCRSQSSAKISDRKVFGCQNRIGEENSGKKICDKEERDCTEECDGEEERRRKEISGTGTEEVRDTPRCSGSPSCKESGQETQGSAACHHHRRSTFRKAGTQAGTISDSD